MRIVESNIFYWSNGYRPSEIVNLPSWSGSSWSAVKRLGFFNSYSLPNAARLKYQSNSAFFFDLCTNAKYFQKIIDYNLSNSYTVLRANKSLHNSSISEDERVESLLKVGFDVGTRLLRKFWKPKSWIQKVVNGYVNNRFNGYFMIGFHLRYQYLSDTDVMQFSKCALEIEKNVKNVTLFEKSI